MAARKREKARPDVNKEVASPMVGRIVGIKKNPGDAVEAGDVLIAVSAMKMVSETFSFPWLIAVTGG